MIYSGKKKTKKKQSTVKLRLQNSLFLRRQIEILARSINGNWEEEMDKRTGAKRNAPRPIPFRSLPHVHFLFPVSHLINAFGFLISRRRKRLFCSVSDSRAHDVIRRNLEKSSSREINL